MVFIISINWYYRNVEAGWGMKKLALFCINFLFFSINQSFAQVPPISPKWVFEPWVWEDTGNNQDSTLKLKNDYLNRGIPVGAVIIDSPWEWPSVPGSNDSGYNTFKFEPSRFSSPDTLINDSLYSQGIHVILWITGNMTTDCPLYEDARDSGYFIKDLSGQVLETDFWRGNKHASHIDFFNPDAKAYWEGLMDSILINYEVDGWKVDESDYDLPDQIKTSEDITKTKQEYSAAYYTEMYTYIHEKRAEGMIMARPYSLQADHPLYQFAPISVNTAGWIGDSESEWGLYGLQTAIEMIFKSAAAGYATVGSDIGGGDYNHDNPQNKELFIRWAQFGALVPIMENGGQNANQHQPWLFDDDVVNVYKYYANFHHELVPYLYSYDIEAHNTGTSILCPVGADQSEWEEHKWEFYLGDNLLVSTIYDDVSSKDIYFPEGSSWINYWDEDDVHQGGGTPVDIDYQIDQDPMRYPIFIRSGAIIPLNIDNSVTGHGSAASRNYLTLLIYPDNLSTFQYYIDSVTTTEIKCDEQSSGYTISFSENTDSVIIRLKNNIKPASVGLNGGVNLDEKLSFSDFEGASSGWFYGKINNNENVYTWIKFSNPADTLYVNSSSISDLCPENYELSKLDVGNKYYIDRNYTLDTIPYEYKGFNMIKTANDDKRKTDLDFHFKVNNITDIYIAYDHRLSIPSWVLDNYVNTGKTISVSDSYLGYFNIWKRTVQPDTVHFFNIGEGSDSSMYFVFYESFSVYIKVFLQSPYAGHDSMYTTLQQKGLVPHSQPYNTPPWNYDGEESVENVPLGVVDWVLVELRSTYNGSGVARRAAFLMSDGDIYDTDSSNHINFSGISPGFYYIIVRQRNHLSVMSADSMSLPNNTAYDFTTGQAQAYTKGSDPMISLGDGNYGMIAGDANGSTVINATDYLYIKSQSGGNGYFNGDCNLSGTVNATDYLVVKPNSGNSSQVP